MNAGRDNHSHAGAEVFDRHFSSGRVAGVYALRESVLAVDVEINAIGMLEDDRADTGLGIHHVAFG